MIRIPDMRRRVFLAGGTVLFGSLAARAIHGQPIPPNLRRCAVAIGIDSYDGPPSLRAAVKGADDMASFLRGRRLRGNSLPRVLVGTICSKVFGAQVFEAVSRLVRDGNVGQLVIYFSGHGVLSGSFEYWLLSGAPFDSSEAVAVWLAAVDATNSGIGNVVLISDACRSPAGSFGMANITGRKIFPGDHPYGHGDVDIFFAAAPNQEAVEMAVDERADAYEGVYTAAFLRAFREPPSDMIHTLDNGLKVVPSERLKYYLVKEVREALKSKPRYAQTPDAFLMSKEPSFIAHVQTGAAGLPARPAGRVEDISVPAALQSAVEAVAPNEELFQNPARRGRRKCQRPGFRSSAGRHRPAASRVGA